MIYWIKLLKIIIFFSQNSMNPTINVQQRPWFLSWFRYVTVEPTMFLYMFAFQLTTVIEQDLFVKKACLANHNFTKEICDNLKNYTDISKEVQVCNIIVCVVFLWTFFYWITDNSFDISTMESYCRLHFSNNNSSFHRVMVR